MSEYTCRIIPNQPTDLLIELRVDGFELREPHEVGAHEDPQFQPLLLPALLLSRVALVLHAHPQLVHLCKVLQNEVDGVLHVPVSAVRERRRREGQGTREGERGRG